MEKESEEMKKIKPDKKSHVCIDCKWCKRRYQISEEKYIVRNEYSPTGFIPSDFFCTFSEDRKMIYMLNPKRSGTCWEYMKRYKPDYIKEWEKML